MLIPSYVAAAPYLFLLFPAVIASLAGSFLLFFLGTESFSTLACLPTRFPTHHITLLASCQNGWFLSTNNLHFGLQRSLQQEWQQLQCTAPCTSDAAASLSEAILAKTFIPSLFDLSQTIPTSPVINSLISQYPLLVLPCRTTQFLIVSPTTHRHRQQTAAGLAISAEVARCGLSSQPFFLPPYCRSPQSPS